jgi:hypothetical protein
MAQTKVQAELWIPRLGIPQENVSYHLWSITREDAEADTSIPFALPADILSATSAIHLLAVRIIDTHRGSIENNRWQHPYDQSADPTQGQAHCISLPNHFLVRHYHLWDDGRNESLNIADLADGDGFSLFVYLPPSPPTPAKIFLIRLCVFVSPSAQTPDPPPGTGTGSASGNEDQGDSGDPAPSGDKNRGDSGHQDTPGSPQGTAAPQERPAPTDLPPRKPEEDSGNRNPRARDAKDPPVILAHCTSVGLESFLQMLNPRWKIEDTLPDGNCGYWAILRSLQDLQSRDDSLALRQWVEIPKSYNGLRPETNEFHRQVGSGERSPETSENYQLMNLLRKQVSEWEKKRIITENWAELSLSLADALSLKKAEGSSANQENPFILPTTLDFKDVQQEKTQEMALTIGKLSAQLFLADLKARVNYGASRFLERFREEATKQPSPYPTIYLQFLEKTEERDLWFDASSQDLENVTKVIKLPVMVIAAESPDILTVTDRKSVV